MVTNGAIIEGLNTRRRDTANADKKPCVDIKTIQEKYLYSFTTKKESVKREYKAARSKHPCESKSNTIRESSDNDIIISNNGDKYVGGVKDGLPDGYGTIASMQGEMFTGEWVDGVQNGMGTYIYPDGDVYSGTWKNGVLHGKGAFINDDEIVHCEYDNGTLVHIDGRIQEKSRRRKILATTSRK